MILSIFASIFCIFDSTFYTKKGKFGADICHILHIFVRVTEASEPDGCPEPVK